MTTPKNLVQQAAAIRRRLAPAAPSYLPIARPGRPGVTMSSVRPTGLRKGPGGALTPKVAAPVGAFQFGKQWFWQNAAGNTAQMSGLPGRRQRRIVRPKGFKPPGGQAPAPILPNPVIGGTPGQPTFPLFDAQYYTELNSEQRAMQDEMSPWQSELRGLAAVDPIIGKTKAQQRSDALLGQTDFTRQQTFDQLADTGGFFSGGRDRVAATISDSYRQQAQSIFDEVGLGRETALQQQIAGRQRGFNDTLALLAQAAAARHLAKPAVQEPNKPPPIKPKKKSKKKPVRKS